MGVIAEPVGALAVWIYATAGKPITPIAEIMFHGVKFTEIFIELANTITGSFFGLPNFLKTF